jgi:serine/threonine-protein kinase
LGEDDVQSTAAVVEEAPLDPHRIAVLPFVNISADASNEYFSDGITEELITQLSKIGQLSVIARTSVMPYKDSDKGIIDIGRELNVGTILEGSVRKAGDQLRIAAQLIDVTSQAHLWAETYDRGIAGIFAIQSDIAGEVAKNLQLKLGAEDQRASTTNTEAYNMYLKALFLYEQGSSDNVLRSVELLKQAVELDTQFGAAYAALADFCNSLPWFSNIAPAEAQRQAKEYANKALAIDEHLARAHVALAEAKMSSDLDWVGAEVEYKRAIALNPSLARARQRYGHRFLLAAMRRDDEALAEVSRAVELDPLSLAALGSRGWVHYHRREYDQAVEWFQKGLELAPDDPWGYIGIGQSLISEGMYEDGIAELKKGLDAAPGLDFLLGYLAWGYGRSGMIEEAENFVAQLKAAAKTKDIAPMAFAWAYTGMGEKDQAIDWLEKAYAERDGAIIFLRVPEFSDVLGDEPRYHALLRKMGLET